jgi:hypothetical protein
MAGGLYIILTVRCTIPHDLPANHVEENNSSDNTSLGYKS